MTDRQDGQTSELLKPAIRRQKWYFSSDRCQEFDQPSVTPRHQKSKMHFNFKQAQMCSTPLKRDCNHRCDHWPFAIVTTGVTTDHWPFTIVTTDLSLYSQFTLCSLKQQTDWHITNITLLLYLCMVKLSKNLDWSALPSFLLVSLNGPIHNPCSLIGQSEWAHASVWMSP